MRKPPGYRVQRPGDLVQIDTLVEILPGVRHQHCIARDVISRWDVPDIHSRATAATARNFLADPGARRPFPISAIQVDGGAARVGAAHPHRGFSQVYELPWRTGEIRPHLQRWQDAGNDIRPHQSLGQRSPASSSPMLAYFLDSLRSQ